jgi:Secretion system C-terminal sorting domain/Domain of unknown function (DUF5122) beta-propeller
MKTNLIKSFLLCLMALSLATHKTSAQTVLPNSQLSFTDVASTNGIYSMVTDGTSTYVGGQFTQVYRFSGEGASISTTTGLADLNYPNVQGAIKSVSDGSGGWFLVISNATGGFVNGSPKNGIVHINSNGSLDMTWNVAVTGGNGITDIVSSGTDLYIGGTFTSVNGTTRNGLAKIAIATGVVNASWNPSVTGDIRTLALDGTNLYVGGLFTSISATSRNNLAKIALSTGTVDATWNPNLNGGVGRLLIIGTDIYVGGGFSGANSVNGNTTRNYLAKFSKTGAGVVDATWNPNPTNGTGVGINDLATNGTDIFVAGSFSNIGGAPSQSVVKLNTNNGNADTGWTVTFDGTGINVVSSLQISGGNVYLGGVFTQINATQCQSLGRVSTTNPATVDATWLPTTSHLSSLCLSGTSLYAITYPSLSISSKVTGFNGVTRYGLAKIYNATGLLDMTWNPLQTAASISSWVTSLTLSNSDLYVGGDIRDALGNSTNNIVKINKNTGVINPNWNNKVTGTTIGEYPANTMFVDGGFLYVGGSFTAANGTTRNNIARFSTTDNGISSTLDPTWNPNINNVVKAMAISGTDIFVGGNFTTVNGSITRNRLAKFTTANSTVDATWNPNCTASVEALAIEGTNIYVGGLFNSNPPMNDIINIGGKGRNGIARLSTTGVGNADNWAETSAAAGGCKRILIDQHSVYVDNLAGIKRVRKTAKPLDDPNFDLLLAPGPSTTRDMYLIGDVLTIGGAFNVVRNLPFTYGYAESHFSNVSVTPDISYDDTGLVTFTGCAGEASTHQIITVYANHLTANVTITAPTNFEISTDGGVSYGTSRTITQTGGSIPNTAVRVRISAASTAGFGSPNLAITSGTITVNAPLGYNLTTKPTITLSAVSSVSTSATSFNLPFSASSGSPTTYSITAVAPNAMPSFVNVVNATFTGISPIPVPIPASGGGTYNFEMTVKTGSCTSTVMPFTLTVTGPTIVVTSTMTAFTGCEGSFVRPTKSYTVSGSNLTANVVITAPAGFEIKDQANLMAMFGSSVTLTPFGGTVNATINVQVTQAATGSPSGNITHVSTGAGTQNVAVSATLTPAPTITIGTVNTVLTSATSFVIPYTATTGSPNQYSVFANGGPTMTGFSSVMNQTLSGTSGNITVTIPASAANTYNFVLAITNTTTGCQGGVMFTLTVAATLPPTITTSGTLTAFNSCAGTVSAEQSYTVSGSNLTSNLNVSALAGFEYSVTSGGTFTSTLSFAPTAGTVTTKTIFVRQTVGASNGASGNIAHTSTTATTQNVAIPASTVNSLPTITGVSATGVNTSATSFQLAYTGVTNSPNQYSIVSAGTATPMPSFSAVSNASLTASPLSITIPTSTANTYTFNLTVRNTTTGCVSAVVPFTLVVSAAVPCTLYVRKDGNDANDGASDNAAGAKLTLQAAMNIVPDGCTIVLNAGTYNESATLTGKSITLQNVGSPIVQTINMNGAGKTLTLTGAIGISEMLNLQAGDAVSNGNLTLLSTATQQAMLINTGTSTVAGNATVQRYFRTNTAIYSNATSGSAYRHISSPVTNADFTQLTDNFSIVVNAAYNTAASPGRVRPYPTIYSYKPTEAGNPAKTISGSNPEFDKGWQSPLSLTSPMVVGTGYTAIAPGNIVLDITGTLNNSPASNITLPIYPASSSMNGSASIGWNFIGNPYPSPISWDAVRALSTGLDDAIYLYTATSTYSGIFSTRVPSTGISSPAGAATDDIAVMQGFIVKANAIGNVVMNNTVRSTTYKNPNSFRSEDDNLDKENGKTNGKTHEKHQGIIRLKMTNPSKDADETVVYFIDKATENYDGKYDALKFKLNEGTVPSIFSNYNKENYAINALKNLKDDMTIPLTVNVASEGKQSISLLEQAGFSRKVELYLLDKATNKSYDLSKTSFEFTAASGLIENRFFLIAKPQFTTAELNGDNLNLYPNPSSETVNISIGDDYKGELTLRLTDISGREVWIAKAEKTGKIYENSVNVENLASGTYILEVSGAKRMVKKVVKN